MPRKSVTEWAMNIAEQTKERSTCCSRQVGAVIIKDKDIISAGYNGAPSKATHCTDMGYCIRKKMGYKSGEGLEHCRAGHAESNALDRCAKHGNSSDGATIYVTTQPCVFCTIRLIQAGIKKVVFKGEYPTDLAAKLADESGLEFIKYEEELDNERLYQEESYKQIPADKHAKVNVIKHN